jgi:serine/threonine protein kinase/tetratricopeptide (TPR) repeat protein
MPAAGSWFGPYEVVGLLGAGGMGEVYRARDPRLGRDVALKILASAADVDAVHQRRLLAEARAASALNHPNILTVYDIGTEQGATFIVSELVEGVSLREQMQRGPLPIRELLGLAVQVAEGLAAAHGAGIVHRDLKPENVMVTREGRVKLVDFGVAQVRETTVDPTLTASPQLTRTDTTVLVGTVPYMSPEQARGTAVDFRSDQFSLGLMLYELATGRHAFPRETPVQTLAAIIGDDPRPIGELNPKVPVPLRWMIDRCLAKEPHHRYAATADLALDLQTLRDHLPDVSSAPFAHQAPRDVFDDLKQARRGEEAHAVITSKAAPSVAVLPFVNVSTDPENQFFCDGVAEELINALTRLPGLQVASRTSAFRFRTADSDIQHIGQQLKVGAIVEGSVRRAGNRLRVTALLINVADGYHLWSDRYDREMADVFAIQDDIVSAIVKALAPALLGDAQRALRRPTDNLEAFELYLRGRHYWHQRTPGALQLALKCFERVIALDPGYVLAHAGLADCYAIFRVYGWHPAEAIRARALEAVSRAMALDPTLSEVLYSQALYTLYFERRRVDAATYLKKAMTISPRNALFHVYLGLVLACGNCADEAGACAGIAADLDPLSATIHWLCSGVFSICRRFDRAERAARRSLELEPDVLTGFWHLAAALCGLEQYSEATTAAERVVSLSRAPVFVGTLGYVHGLTGRVDDALRLLAELDDRAERGEYVVPYARLLIHVGLGDMTAIRSDLEVCVNDRSPSLPIKFVCDRTLETYRCDPDIDRLVSALYEEAQS